MRRFWKGLLVTLLALPVLFAALAWYTLTPKEMNLPLPEGLISAESAEGRALLASAEYTADFDVLDRAYEPQKYMSFCGVASSVTLLKAFGRQNTQSNFFTDATSEVRSRFEVTFGGMTLEQLDGLLQAHGVETQSIHGDDLTLEELRSIITRNLAAKDDFLLVNYQREALGQGRSGHISPLAAYDSSSDRALIMDTADFKYPYTWVPLDQLHGALLEIDAASGRPRGILEARL